MHDLRCDEWMFLKNQLLPVGGATGGLCDGTRVGGESSEGFSPTLTKVNSLAAGETGGLCSRIGSRG